MIAIGKHNAIVRGLKNENAKLQNQLRTITARMRIQSNSCNVLPSSPKSNVHIMSENKYKQLEKQKHKQLQMITGKHKQIINKLSNETRQMEKKKNERTNIVEIVDFLIEWINIRIDFKLRYATFEMSSFDN